MPDQQQPILTLGDVAELTGGELHGTAATAITHIAPISTAGPGALTWVGLRRYSATLAQSGAAAAIAGPDIDFGATPAVVCPHPDRAMAAVLEHLRPPVHHPPVGVHPTAVIDEAAILGPDVALGPLVVVQSGARIGARSILHAGAYVGHNSSIGEDCVLWPQVVIRERCTIGHRVTLHPNVTVGADGFGYNFVDDHYEGVPQIGTVRIEDDVEIGACSCIDRAKCDETVIGRGTKIDNLVQVAHNVKIGAHCCLVSQVAIGGSTVLGDYVLFGGKVGVRDNIKIGNQARAAACTCIGIDVADKEVVVGIPATTKMDHFRQLAGLRKLPEAMKLIKDLIKRVEQLESAND